MCMCVMCMCDGVHVWSGARHILTHYVRLSRIVSRLVCLGDPVLCVMVWLCALCDGVHVWLYLVWWCACVTVPCVMVGMCDCALCDSGHVWLCLLWWCTLYGACVTVCFVWGVLCMVPVWLRLCVRCTLCEVYFVWCLCDCVLCVRCTCILCMTLCFMWHCALCEGGERLNYDPCLGP